MRLEHYFNVTTTSTFKTSTAVASKFGHDNISPKIHWEQLNYDKQTRNNFWKAVWLNYESQWYSFVRRNELSQNMVQDF